jgi:hypothetical protein
MKNSLPTAPTRSPTPVPGYDQIQFFYFYYNVALFVNERNFPNCLGMPPCRMPTALPYTVKVCRTLLSRCGLRCVFRKSDGNVRQILLALGAVESGQYLKKRLSLPLR